jgi:hypothetical protein
MTVSKGNGPTFEEQASEAMKRVAGELKLEITQLPTVGVAAFVADLAKAHGVAYRRSRIDDFAEAVSRLSGDGEPLDTTGKLLVALRKKSIINGRQLARLMSNHIKER